MRETHVHLPAYHFQVGRALAQSGEWARAAESLRRAVELRPSYGEAHGLLSRCYFRLGQDGLGARHQALARAR
jgi:Flp pilus assembly protein TadD